ncbi:MAG: hypothetical protein HC848_08255, partial [Limnobacter sp.]|nr:hypothetical protein [Limnobacter sp.]
PAASAQSDKLDIGNRVQVTHWEVGKQAHVLYRGAQWQAVCLDDIPQTGLHEIANVQNSTLQLKAVKVLH